MQTVGLREFKTHFGEYMNRARRGEHIVITDRGREVAELGPLSAARRAMLAHRREGRVSWSGGKPAGLRGHSARGKSVAETLLEDRG